MEAVEDRLSEFKQIAARYPQVAREPTPPALAVVEKPKRRSIFHRRSKLEETAAPLTEDLSQAPPPDPMEMDNFFQQLEAIKTNIGEVSRWRLELDTAQRSVLSQVASEEIEEQEALIEAYLAKVNRAAVAAKRDLSELAADTERVRRKAPPGSGDLRMRQLQHAHLTSRLSEAMAGVRQIQRDFEERRREKVERMYRLDKPEASEEDVQTLLAATTGMTLTGDDLLALIHGRNPDLVLQEMKQRRASVIAIETGIEQLSQLFIDMQTIVVEQGALLDQIAANLNLCEEYIEAGNVEMVQAVEYQKARKKCLVI